MNKFNIGYVIASLICAAGLVILIKSKSDLGLGVTTFGLIISCINAFAEKRSKDRNKQDNP